MDGDVHMPLECTIAEPIVKLKPRLNRNMSGKIKMESQCYMLNYRRPYMACYRQHICYD